MNLLVSFPAFYKRRFCRRHDVPLARFDLDLMRPNLEINTRRHFLERTSVRGASLLF